MHHIPYNHRELEYKAEKFWKENAIQPQKEERVKAWNSGNEYLEEYVLDYGKDTLYLYELFVGFSTDSQDEDAYEEHELDGVYNFLKKLYRISVANKEHLSETETECMEEKRQQMLLDFQAPLEKGHARAYVALLMEYCNKMYDFATEEKLSKALLRDYLRYLALVAPRQAEANWQELGWEGSVFAYELPLPEQKYVEQGTVVLPVQINGKKRAEVTLLRNASESDAKNLAYKALRENGIDEQNFLGKRFVYVAGKIINIVTMES